MAYKLNGEDGFNHKSALVTRLLILLSMCVVSMACDNHETQYTYYDDSKSIIKEMYEVDKTTGKKDGDYKRYDQKGAVIYTAKYVNDELQRNYFTDKRDGRKYKITTIGNQTWMGENLAYETDESYCYNDDPKNCQKYGRLYEWHVAVHACPDGWDLPRANDFKELIETAYGTKIFSEEENVSYKDLIKKLVVGARALKSQSGWYEEVKSKRKNSGGVPDGTDDFDFTVLPTGYKSRMEGMYDTTDEYLHGGRNGNAYFWGKIENTNYPLINISFNAERKDGIVFKSDRSVINLNPREYKNAYSIRCIKSNGERKDSVEKITDSRDGQTYRIVSIGDQTWMAENLNYKTKDGSVCPSDEGRSYCEKYGRLYDWKTAQKACPTGWHLPSKEEFERLFALIESRQDFDVFEEDGDRIVKLSKNRWKEAGLILKSIDGWNKIDAKRAKGTDAYGFAALPAGMTNLYDEGGECHEIGSAAFFWSSTKRDEDGLYHMELKDFSGNGYLTYLGGLADQYSVRCIKD